MTESAPHLEPPEMQSPLRRIRVRNRATLEDYVDLDRLVDIDQEDER